MHSVLEYSPYKFVSLSYLFKRILLITMGIGSYLSGLKGRILLFEMQVLSLCEQLNIDTIEQFIALDAAGQWALHCV
jgi:hypothetical protein